jgi:hypothetical protein
VVARGCFRLRSILAIDPNVGANLVATNMATMPAQIHPRLATTALVLLCAVGIGCARRSAESSEVNRGLEKEQVINHLVIGRRDDTTLDYVDMTDGGRMTNLHFSPQEEVASTSIDPRDTASTTSSDGTWKADCREQQCILTRVADPFNNFAVSRNGLLTPLYWSPDGKFLFFVKEAPRWRLPLRCSFEDEHDITVLDLKQHHEGVVSTVCEGYPYGGLRWYRLTH